MKYLGILGLTVTSLASGQCPNVHVVDAVLINRDGRSSYELHAKVQNKGEKDIEALEIAVLSVDASGVERALPKSFVVNRVGAGKRKSVDTNSGLPTSIDVKPEALGKIRKVLFADGSVWLDVGQHNCR